MDEDKASKDDSDTKRGGTSSQSKSGGEGDGKRHLLSPTSLVAPPEMEAAIFSIPRSEVCQLSHTFVHVVSRHVYYYCVMRVKNNKYNNINNNAGFFSMYM